MAQEAGKSSIKRKPTHYVNSILITSLALTLVGIIGILFISFRYEENAIKESIQVSVYLDDGLDPADAEKLNTRIGGMEGVKSTEYISKEDAAKRVKEKFGEDISQILGDYNPLPASIEVYLQAARMNGDSLEAFREEVTTFPGVNFTKVDESLVNSVNYNFRILGIIFAALSVLFLVIAITIIDKTIRLSMYANRFIIRSMQLVGATRGFITGPYVKRSVVNGIVSALASCIVLVILVITVHRRYNYWNLSDTGLRLGFALVFAGLFGAGILITWYSTRNSVHKYIRMKLDELY